MRLKKQNPRQKKKTSVKKESKGKKDEVLEEKSAEGAIEKQSFSTPPKEVKEDES